ncbi:MULTISPECIES: DUF3168 domain-containing protein [Rhizobium/Agrobacterium group]|uniref:DUF3168 domain-containing protein n=1 Tax=Rhizobium/Agrobacterium group TaxID=227290 RepID=UPI000B3F9F03|nr:MULTISPECIES: DUF3168 domain-containing protein [Rhizobium/Agrobacterium group]MCF1481666.1 DUF3168 domain-containing protein [Allorhizobium ampelinum]NSZ42563.1 DUF3168 domain-containing protein [Agrobacterium vitis]NTA26271.1 DUF3168 domain-containing protein [Allorhizobium ampelinum]OVE95574.1 hypothetical protein B7W85_07130 [Allorhizobium ampelinum]
MSEDAAHELQVAIVTCLKADADVTALIAGRVYDRVPQGVSLPYVSFGPTQELPEDADGLNLSDLFIQLSVWSDDPGYAEGRRIAKAVVAALSGDTLSLNDNALVYLELDSRRDLRDPDGLTTHIALTFRAAIENH